MGRVALPRRQLALLLPLLGLGGLVILATIQEAALSTVVLLVFVSVAGLALCRRTRIRLNDRALNILGEFWLLKLALTLFLLYMGWMPQLDPGSSDAWGYDPQRFYVQARELIDNNWIPDFASLNLNYVGILYYYGASFYIVGYNPVVSALVNAFVTLMACLYLVKVGYEVKWQRGRGDWMLSFSLLLPETLWFDVMTSRETLLAALLLFAMLQTGRYFGRMAPVSLPATVAVVGLSMLGIAAVRASMLLPVFVSIALMAWFVKPQGSRWPVKRVIVIILAGMLLVSGPVVTEYLGGYSFDLRSLLAAATSASHNIALSDDMHWSERSIGMLLLPDGVLQAVLFLLPRMVLYLLAPLPNVYLSIGELLAGSWVAWQNLFTALSSVINLLLAPFVLASLVRSIKMRKTNATPLVLQIPYWVTFAAISGGNLIIQERYRVMASLLFLGCAWLGASTCSRRQVFRASLLWYGLLSAGAIFYLSYKYVLA